MNLDYIITNWKTTAFGVAVAVAVAVRDAYLTGQLNKSTVVVVVLIAAWGAIMKDANITGGDKMNANVPKDVREKFDSEERRTPTIMTVKETKEL